MSDTIETIQEIDGLELAHSFECDITELNKHLHVKRNDFTMITQNIRSIYCNFDDFILNISSFKFSTDVIVLTECRISCHKPLPQLGNYYQYYTEFRLNQNDGVLGLREKYFETQNKRDTINSCVMPTTRYS